MRSRDLFLGGAGVLNASPKFIHHLFGRERRVLVSNTGKGPSTGIVEQIAAGTEFLRWRHPPGLLKVFGVEFG
jgi:hypothetical protein